MKLYEISDQFKELEKLEYIDQIEIGEENRSLIYDIHPLLTI